MSKAQVRPSKVVSFSYMFDGDGRAFYACVMSDQSIWHCDENGEKWEKISLSPDELTVKFKEHLASEEKKLEKAKKEQEVKDRIFSSEEEVLEAKEK